MSARSPTRSCAQRPAPSLISFEGVSRAAVWAENTLEAIVATVAMVESGIESVPLNPKLGSSELDHILSDSQPEAVVGAPQVAPLGHLRRFSVELDATGELPEAPADPERVALVVYTSGTTGRPKGALLPRRAVAANLDALADAWSGPRRTLVARAAALPRPRAGARHRSARCAEAACFATSGGFSPEAVAAALRDGATMLFGVPTMYHRLAEARRDRPGGWQARCRRARLLVSGSAALPAPEFERIERADRPGDRRALRHDRDADEPGGAGRRRTPRPAASALRCRASTCVCRRRRHELAASDGETMGEVVVRGPNLFTRVPEPTRGDRRGARAMAGSTPATSRLALPTATGGSSDGESTDLIKTGGFKVGAGEIEVRAARAPGVSEVAVTGRARPGPRRADRRLGRRCATARHSPSGS